MLKRTAKRIANYLGNEVNRVRAKWRGEPFDAGLLKELEATESEILRRIEPYTAASPERVLTLIRATRKPHPSTHIRTTFYETECYT